MRVTTRLYFYIYKLCFSKNKTNFYLRARNTENILPKISYPYIIERMFPYNDANLFLDLLSMHALINSRIDSV